MSVFSYVARDSTYLYHGFRAGGAVIVYQGQTEGTGLRFSAEQGAGATRTRTRITISPRTDGLMLFEEETATGDGPWNPASKFNYKKVAR